MKTGTGKTIKSVRSAIRFFALVSMIIMLGPIVVAVDHQEESAIRSCGDEMRDNLQEPVFPEDLSYLFKSGTEGYHTFRIPALVSAGRGTLVAFAEGRKRSASDAGDIDLVFRRSEDGGKTWGALKVLWDDGDNVCGNPAPVFDTETGILFLLSTWNLGEDHEPEIIAQTSRDTRRIFLLSSPDGGRSWSAPLEITPSVKKPEWTWYATGPCHGIQLESGLHRGRMVIPCDHIEAGSKRYYSHVIYSDDHGHTWQLGGITPQDQVNECTVAELSDGRLLLNMRNYDRTQKTRKISHSTDGGQTWGPVFSDPVLVEPICQATLLKMPGGKKKPGKLLFLNPSDENQRIRMTLQISDDDGKTWKAKKLLFGGPSAYSDLVWVKGDVVGCLFEAGLKSPYEGIVFMKVKTGK